MVYFIFGCIWQLKLHKEHNLKNGVVRGVLRLRKVKVNNRVFLVPTRIQRIDDEGTHGWQMLHGVSDGFPSVFFSDSTYGGPAESLKAAITTKIRRIRELRLIQKVPRGYIKAHDDLIRTQLSA